MEIHQALGVATSSFGLARLDAQLLLLYALGRPPQDRAWLLAHDRETLTSEVERAFMQLVQRRASGMPLAYLTGMHEFYGLPLAVDARVLDPRPDTETLVDWALDLLPDHSTCAGDAPCEVIDLGTGSGAIALALKHARPELLVSAVDASADALTVARANAQRLGLTVSFRQGNWLGGIDQHFDLIVSNPPYLAEDDPHLAQLVHEPRQALTSGTDGLDAIRTIVKQAPSHLRPGGWLLLEHGWQQAEAVRGLLAQAGFTEVQSRQDLAGIERCSGGRWARPPQ